MCFNFMFSMLDPLMLHLQQWIALNLLHIVGFYLLCLIAATIRECGGQGQVQGNNLLQGVDDFLPLCALIRCKNFVERRLCRSL
jgi:hypothetical protein